MGQKITSSMFNQQNENDTYNALIYVGFWRCATKTTFWIKRAQKTHLIFLPMHVQSNAYRCRFLQFKLIFDSKKSFHDSLKLLGMGQRVLKNETEN